MFQGVLKDVWCSDLLWKWTSPRTGQVDVMLKFGKAFYTATLATLLCRKIQWLAELATINLMDRDGLLSQLLKRYNTSLRTRGEIIWTWEIMHVYEKYKHFKINISVLRSGYTLCVFCQMQLIKATCYIYVYNALTVIIFIVIAFNLLVYIVNNVLKSPYVVNHCLCVIKSFFMWCLKRSIW